MKVNIGPYPKNSTKSRKISIHIDNYDIFNMDTTLALIIIPMLKMRKDCATYPGGLTSKNWDKILD